MRVMMVMIVPYGPCILIQTDIQSLEIKKFRQRHFFMPMNLLQQSKLRIKKKLKRTK